MRTGDNAAGGDGSHGFIKQCLHTETALIIGSHLIDTTACAVGGIVITPIVKANAMWVGGVVCVMAVLKGTRVETIHGTVAMLLVLGPGSLHITDVEYTALVVEVTARSVGKGVGTMVGVGRIEAMEHTDTHVGYVIAIGVLQKKDVRDTGNNDAAIPEFKPGGVMYLGKGDGFICYSIAVFIRQDQESVLHFLQGFPFGIGRPSGSPQATLGVYCHLDRVGHFGEHFL